MMVCYQMTKALLLAYLRDKRALVILLLMPLVTTTILSFALGPEFQGKSIPRFTVAVANADTGTLGKQLIQVFDGMTSQLTVKQIDSVPATPLASTVQVEIPKRFSEMASHGKLASVTVKASANASSEEAVVAGVINQFGRRAGIQLYTARAEQALHKTLHVPTVQMHVKSAGLHLMTAGSYYAVGMMVLFLLTTALGRAYTVVSERKSDISKRLASAPVNKRVLTVGYVVSNFLVLGVQGAINLICDRWILGVYLGPWWQVGILVAAYALALAGLAVMVGSWIDNESVVNSIGSIGGNVAAVLGGSIYPIYVFPNIMQWLAKVLPNGQVMNGFINTISGIALAGLGTSILYLVGFGIIASLLASFRQWRPTSA